MIKKDIKILGNSFKHYNTIADNVFTESDVNLISNNNLDELVNSFNNRELEVFIYDGHKQDQGVERQAIGKVLNIQKKDDGLYADIEIDDRYMDGTRYPSIEMVGRKVKDTEEGINWENCELKALALVEYPASKSVDLLCASGIMTEQAEELNNDINIIDIKEILQGEAVMREKLIELLTKIKAGEESAKSDFIKLLDEDNEFMNALIDTLLAEPVKVVETETETEDGKVEKEVEVKEELEATEPEAKKQEDEEKKEEKENLSAVAYKGWCDVYAESLGAIRCSSKSVEATFGKAKKLHKGGFSREEILSMVANDLQLLGKENVREEVNMSANKDSIYSSISDAFKY